jgi:hypothetical protein
VLLLSLVLMNQSISLLAARGHHRCWKPTMRPLLRHLGEPHRPSSCTAHAPWSPLARVGYLLPPRPPTSHHRSRCRTDRSRGDCALRGRRAPQPQLARPASRPRAQPMAMAACHAKWTMSPRGRGLRARSQPMSRKMFFFFQNSENE